jgi:uncharacterized membrane protein YbhN (UPF0104 family)
MLKKILNTAFIIAFVVAGIVYFRYNRSAIALLQGISPWQVLFLSSILFLFICISGQAVNLTLQLSHTRLSVSETIWLAILGNFGNYIAPILPGAGTALKAIYLRSTRSLEYSSFSACFLANLFISFWVLGISGLILAIISSLNHDSVPALLMVLCLFLAAIPILLFFMKIPGIDSNKRLLVFLKNTLAAFGIMRKNKLKIIEISLLLAIQLVAGAAVFYYTYSILGRHLSFFASLSISVFISIVNVFAFTPNGIGIQEIILAFLLMKTGLDFSSGLIGASMIRIAHIGVTFVFAPFAYFFLFKSKGISMKDSR